MDVYWDPLSNVCDCITAHWVVAINEQVFQRNVKPSHKICNVFCNAWHVSRALYGNNDAGEMNIIVLLILDFLRPLFLGP